MNLCRNYTHVRHFSTSNLRACIENGKTGYIFRKAVISWLKLLVRNARFLHEKFELRDKHKL